MATRPTAILSALILLCGALLLASARLPLAPVAPPTVGVLPPAPKPKPKPQPAPKVEPPRLSKAQQLQERKNDALIYALKYEDFAAVKKAVRAGADLHYVSPSGYEPLLEAVANAAHAGTSDVSGAVAAVKYLLARGAYSKSELPLEWALGGAHEGVIRLSLIRVLLNAGADPNEEFASGLTPLAAAAAYPHLEATKLLLRHGAKINGRDMRGRTALMYVVQFYVVPDEYNHAESSLKMLRFLIARGAQINARDSDGKTALMLSLISDYDYKDYQKGLLNFNFKLEAMKFLIENGALVNARDKRGKTALMLATMAHYGDGYQEQWEKKRWAALRYLLDHGAQINARDDDGWTPLMHAVANYERFNVQGGSVYAPDPKDELVTVQYLLKRGADPNVRAKNGISALQLARDEPFMLGVLRKAGAR